MNVRRVSISTVTLKNNDWIKKICMCLGSITIIIKFLRGKKTSMKYIDFFIKKKKVEAHIRCYLKLRKELLALEYK